jgi:hypothetical protein
MRTDTQTIIAAMRHLAATIQSDDGVANASIAEAADRLAELANQKAAIVAELRRLEAEWSARVAHDTEAGLYKAAAFCSGVSSGVAVAIRVVEAGGALPPEVLSDESNQVSE